MYLHVGADTVIPLEDILGIFDLDNASWSHITRAALRRAEQEGRVVNIAEDLPKSMVLTCRDGTERIILSQLNSATLLRRAESDSFAQI
ncbi:MAG: DUF370 domain-containing protein [Oscillospiraceae bacterium]|nr:DUF370 domain-containing protein [Oscillospiraceae bacterium]